MITVWVPLTPTAEQLNNGATSYGLMIDHLYAVNGQSGEMRTNIARRSSWPEGRYVYADWITEAEVCPVMGYMDLPCRVFVVEAGTLDYEFETSDEQGQDMEHMTATDWQVSVRI